MRPGWRVVRGLAGVVSLGLVACTGSIGEVGGEGAMGGPPGPLTGGPTGPGTSPARPGSPSGSPSVAPAGPGTDTGGFSAGLRRLTRRQYDNTVAMLLGEGGAPGQALMVDEKAGTFNANSVSPISLLGVDQYGEVARVIAQKAIQNLAPLLPCDPARVGEAACARQFIERFAKRAYRRPPTEDEVRRIFAVYEGKAKRSDFKSGIGLVIEAVLQSPHFLYHVELGQSGTAPDARLTDYEVASRLSYFIWGSMPDDDLFAAADARQLSGADGLRAQAQRLLADARAEATFEDFVVQWMGVEHIEHAEKDPKIYPEFTAAVRTAAFEETRRFVRHVFRETGARPQDLLAAPFGFASGALAALYGVERPGVAEPSRLDLDPTRRSGLLTQVAILAAHSNSDQSSPVRRGVFVREHLLCQRLPSPPDDVEVTIPPLDPENAKSTRERFALHRRNATCATCHDLIDPIGLGFENFDGIGRYREREAGKAVDATGELTNTDVDGAFEGAVALGQKLVKSQIATACIVQNLLSYALGREATDADRRAIEILARDFTGDKRVDDMIIRLATSEAFRITRNAP